MVERIRDAASPAGRALALLRGASRAVAQSKTERELLDEICRLAVEVTGYRMAWIGYARDDERKSVEPVAHAGVNRGYLEEIEVTWGSEPSGQGPTGTAIRMRKSVSASSLADDVHFAPWRDAALRRGYAASIAVPIETADGVIGALNIYAGEPDAFPPDEVQSLDDLGRELAFGIEAARTREGRDQAVERLVESEAQTQAIIAAIPDLLFRIDHKGVYREFVPSTELQPLVPPDEFLGKSMDVFFPKAFADHAMRDVQSVLETGEIRTHEYELLVGTEMRAFEYRMVRVSEDEVLGIVRDITEARRREEALRAATAKARESEEMFRDLAEKSLTGVYVIQDHRFKYVNRRLAEVFGYSVTEMVSGLGPKDVTHEEDWPTVAENLRRREVGEVESINYGFRGVTKEGAVRDIEVFGTRTRFRGRPAVIGTLLDVTERNRAQGALVAAEARLRNIVEHSTNMFYSHGPDHVLTYLSPQVEHVLGYPPREAMRRWTEFLTDDPNNQRGLELTQRAIDTGERQPPYELELLHRSGRRVWVEVREAPIVRDGRTTAIVGSLTDITERRRYEQELRESREALRRLAANLEDAREAERRRVARELHDELGQALTGLKMDVAWLRDRLDEGDSSGRKRVEETLALIHTTVDAVRRISAELRPGVLDDLGLAAAIRWQTREFMRRTNIGVRLVSDDGVPELDGGRATAVFRIFQEALTNVARHASASEVVVRIAVEHGQLLLRIEDNGRGLRPEEIRSRRSMGLLGMRERASAWGGTLALGERPEGGTTVELRMPLPDDAGGAS